MVDGIEQLTLAGADGSDRERDRRGRELRMGSSTRAGVRSSGRPSASAGSRPESPGCEQTGLKGRMWRDGFASPCQIRNARHSEPRSSARTFGCHLGAVGCVARDV